MLNSIQVFLPGLVKSLFSWFRRRNALHEELVGGESCAVEKGVESDQCQKEEKKQGGNSKEGPEEGS